MNDLKKITIPWNDKICAKLNVYQIKGEFHPYTCEKCSETLIARKDGWFCANCNKIVQTWFHSSTLNMGL